MTTRRQFVRLGAGALGVGLAGCSSDGESGDGGADDELGLSNLVFAAEEPGGYMDYEEQPDATYDADDTVWVYVNVDGVSSEENDDGTREVWIVEHLTVTDPAGETILDEEVLNSHRNWSADDDLDKLFLANDVTLPRGAESGEYTIEVSLEDRLAEETATISGNFQVEA